MVDERIETYKQSLLRWNRRINLIGPEARENLDAHIAEALAAAEILRPAGEVLDFGSGGGLPGVPMALVSPAARFHFVESDQKKWAFLKHVVRECGLNAQVHGDRLTRFLAELSPDVRFDLVISRAVGSPGEWLPEVVPHLRAGARVGLFQGTPEPPRIDGFASGETHLLPRGQANYLVTLLFHVEHR